MSEQEAGPGTPIWASLSSRGGRPDNQDRCGDAATPTGRAFIVADGLGGHAGGAAAATACVEAALHALKAGGELGTERLRAALDAAQRAVQEVPLREPSADGCRTTAVVLEISAGRATWAHVGDTRLYHFRDGRVAHQTLDHSMPQALVQAGAIRSDEIRRHPERNRLLKSLGGEGEVAPTFLEAPIALAPGDAFLLCTDGFWELVTEDEMQAALAGASGPAAWLERMESQVLKAATGAFDNYSATTVLVKGRRAPDAARAKGGLGRALLVAVSIACLAAAAISAFRCATGTSTPPLVISALPAGGLPGCEPPLSRPPGPRLHSGPAKPPRGVGS